MVDRFTGNEATILDLLQQALGASGAGGSSILDFLRQRSDPLSALGLPSSGLRLGGLGPLVGGMSAQSLSPVMAALSRNDPFANNNGQGTRGQDLGGGQLGDTGYSYQEGELRGMLSGDPARGSGLFAAPASYTGSYEELAHDLYDQVLAENPTAIIPSWAWKYVLDAEARGYPPGSYGQTSDGTWLTPDGRGPGDYFSGRYSGGKNVDAWQAEQGLDTNGDGIVDRPLQGGRPPNDHGPGTVTDPLQPGDAFPTARTPHANTGPGGGRDTGRGSGGRGFAGGGGGRDDGGGGQRRRDRGGTANVTGRISPFGTGFTGGGFPMPDMGDRRNRDLARAARGGNNDRRETGWADLARDMGLGGGGKKNGGRQAIKVSENGRRVRYSDGTVERQGKERTRNRTRSGPAGTTTTITINRSGGKAVSNQSGGNGNRGRNAGNGGNANSNANGGRVVQQPQRAPQQNQNKPQNQNNNRNNKQNQNNRQQNKRKR